VGLDRVLGWPTMRFGIEQWRWDEIVRELRQRIETRILAGRKPEPLTYSVLVTGIPEIPDPHSYMVPHLHQDVVLLGRADGVSMLSAGVVLAAEGVPAEGFYALARELGHDLGTEEGGKPAFWVQ
jgi:hypothetical protein